MQDKQNIIHHQPAKKVFCTQAIFSLNKPVKTPAWTAFLFLALFLLSCHKETVRHEISFYHWKQNLDSGNSWQVYLSKLEVKKLYLRLFDVSWDHLTAQAKPVSVFATQKLPTSFSYIPVIYITNEVLERSKATEIKTLAQNILTKIAAVAKKAGLPSYTELQIDCDWSLSTKEKYFLLLEAIKKAPDKQGKLLSATIRLHQIKFFEKTGIPPVDKGVLMFYNMGNLRDTATKNSILDLNAAASYLPQLTAYPLHLDIALPLFSWAVVYRGGRIIHLLPNASEQLLKRLPHYTQTGQNKFSVIKSTYYQGIYLYKGDKLRLETITEGQLKDAAKLLNQYLPQQHRTILFYHLDETIIQKFPHEKIKETVGLFH